MSMFNSHQREWMAYLASLPPEAKCACGWHRKGECHNCNRRESFTRTPDTTPTTDAAERSGSE
jgi:hypothetical protein